MVNSLQNVPMLSVPNANVVEKLNSDVAYNWKDICIRRLVGLDRSLYLGEGGLMTRIHYIRSSILMQYYFFLNQGGSGRFELTVGPKQTMGKVVSKILYF